MMNQEQIKQLLAFKEKQSEEITIKMQKEAEDFKHVIKFQDPYYLSVCAENNIKPIKALRRQLENLALEIDLLNKILE